MLVVRSQKGPSHLVISRQVAKTRPVIVRVPLDTHVQDEDEDSDSDESETIDTFTRVRSANIIIQI